MKRAWLIVGLVTAATGGGAGTPRLSPTSPPPEPVGPRPVNLAPNPGFEIPDSTKPHLPAYWGQFSIGGVPGVRVTTEEALEGKRSLQVNMIPRPGAVEGVLANIGVEPKARYVFRVSAKRAAESRPGGGYFKLVVEWLDEHNEELKRDQTPAIPLGRLSRRRWKTFELKKVRAPRKAVRANFGIQFFSQGMDRATILVDGVEIVRP